MAVVVLGEVALMGARKQSAEARWTIHGVEKLLSSLTGVVSVRLVAKPGSDIEEIHLLTTEEVTPKQTVRNVESALLAHFDLEIDHRKISVAQTSNPPAPEAGKSTGSDVKASPVVRSLPTASEPRLLFLAHQVETQRSQRVRMMVTLEWQGSQYQGESSGPDLPRSRLDTIANATLRAVEAATGGAEGARDFSLALDGVTLTRAFDRDYVLVSVHALDGGQMTHLNGSAVVTDTPDKAVILAALQATDRWVRGRV